MSPFPPHRSPCLSLNASNVLLDQDLPLLSTEILSFRYQHIQCLTSFRSLLKYHLQRSSHSTPSKTKLLNHLISSFTCLFVCNKGHLPTHYIFTAPPPHQENGGPMEEGDFVFSLVLYIQDPEWCLAPSTSGWRNLPGSFQCRACLATIRQGSCSPSSLLIPFLSKASRRDHLHNESHITESLFRICFWEP